jgi:hypothetical protein
MHLKLSGVLDNMSTKPKTLYAYLVLIILYSAGTLLIPPTKGTLHRYHITSQHLRLLDLTIIILYAAIWFCAIYGFYSFRQYYLLIKKTKDGKPLSKVTTGIGFLAFWFPITSVFNTYAQLLVEKHASFASSVAITENYLSLLMPLLGFIFISIGARQLIDIVKQRPSLLGINVLVILLISIGVTYVYLVLNTHNRLNTYHLSTLYVLITLVIPYIYMWFIGLLSLYEVILYRVKIPGILYRESWRLSALGLGSLIIISIIIQYLTTVSERLDRLSLSTVLLVIYGLLILLSIAYILIALGVHNLKKIEEV